VYKRQMREDVDDLRRRYEAAATRVVELETEKRRARDSKNFERLVGASSSGGTKTNTKTPPLRSLRASDASAASSFLAFSDDADMDSLPGSARAGNVHAFSHVNAYDARYDEGVNGDKTPRRVSAGSARKKESTARGGGGTGTGTGTHHHPRKGRASSPHRRSSSPRQKSRGGSPRISRRSAGSDDAAPGFTEKIDVD